MEMPEFEIKMTMPDFGMISRKYKVQEVGLTKEGHLITEQNFEVYVKQMRIAWGMTQEQMAKVCDISSSALSRIERGDQSPSISLAVKMLDELGLRLVATSKL